MDDLPAALSHVYWIGGGSGAAKSTVARRLLEKNEAILFDTDAAMRDHADRCNPVKCPHLAEFRAMNMDERWVRRTPQLMLDSFHWFEGEGFEFIIEDLLALPHNKPIIAEGFRLLPTLVAPLLQDRARAIWLLPTSEFRRIAFDARASTWDIPFQTSDPDKALANLLSRDALFTKRLEVDIQTLKLNSIVVDGILNEDQLLKAVNERLFGKVGPV